MIRVTIYKANDKIRGFMTEGHSGYSTEGYDIVCASVSILSYTALNSLNAVAGLSPEDILYKVEEDIGLMSVRTLKNNDITHMVYKIYMVGIELLLEDYSDYITLKFEEV